METRLPLGLVTANLQPWVKPGSKPITIFPRKGGVSSTRFKFVANTSTDAFSANLVSSDLPGRIQVTGAVEVNQWNKQNSPSYLNENIITKLIILNLMLL